MQNIINCICKKTSDLLKETGSNISVNLIARDIREIYNGKSIKIMNSIDSDNDDYFVLRNKTYILVTFSNCEGKAVSISDEMFVDLMANFYACRVLSFDQRDRSKQIFELSRSNDLLIRKSMINQSHQ